MKQQNRLKTSTTEVGGSTTNASSKKKPQPKPITVKKWTLSQNAQKRVRFLVFIFLLLSNLSILLALISHLWFGYADQSLAEYGALPPINEGSARNWLGSVGAWLGDFFITRGFGISAIVLPICGITFTLALLAKQTFLQFFQKALPVFFFILFWLPPFLSFWTLLFGLSYTDWGGYIGKTLDETLIFYVGYFGLAAILLVIGTLFVSFYFDIFNIQHSEIFPKLLSKLPKSWQDKLSSFAQKEPPKEAALERLDSLVEVAKARENTFVGTESAWPNWPESISDNEDSLSGEFQVDTKWLSPEKAVDPSLVFSSRLETDEPVVAPKPDMVAEEKNIIPTDPLLHFSIKSAQDNPKSVPQNITPKAPSTPHPIHKIGEIEFSVEIPKQEEPLATLTEQDNVYFEQEEKSYRLLIEPESQETLESDDNLVTWEDYDPTKELSNYQYPTLELLKQYETNRAGEINREELEQNKNRIIKTLRDYNIEITSIRVTVGPTVTLYEITPAPGIRISKIKGLEDDIALSLAALGIRIIAPMPGKGTIGIEIPNSNPEIVSFRSVVATEKFRDSKAELPIAIGKTISNEVFVADLTKMPHLLVAGATGQGKSVGLNNVIASILYKKHPAQVKFVLIDPKKVEMTLYQQLEKHFLAKLPNTEEAIITDNKQVIHVLNSLCLEMENRYKLLQAAKVRNISEYNARFIGRNLNPQKGHRFLPYIVLIIDELADLMMTAGKEVETPIARLAQLARAIGIHLVVATQRPSVNVITGIIKANFPARMSYRVISKTDSRTILDCNGADQLIGKGDLLFSTGTDFIRIQNAFIDTPEVERLVEFISNQHGYSAPYYLPELLEEGEDADNEGYDASQEYDTMFEEAARLVVRHQQGSTSLIQRRLKLGYNRAGRIMDQLERAGIVGPNSGSKARDVLLTDEVQLEKYFQLFRKS